VRGRSLVSEMYRAARVWNDVSTIASGNPKRIARRCKNKVLERSLARAGLWKLLWSQTASIGH
jgi:hypothetical protein